MTAPDLGPASYPTERPAVDLDALLSDETPLIYRTSRDKAAAMLADAGTYLAIVTAQRAAEAAGERVPSDEEALGQEGASEPCMCGTTFTCVADEHEPSPCGCFGRVDWWRNPECVQSQPPEFVIDDARPGVLRAPRPDDFAGSDS